jgi:hypothetical protein
VGGAAQRDEAAACTHLDEINDKVHNFALVHGFRVEICDQKGDVEILRESQRAKRVLQQSHHGCKLLPQSAFFSAQRSSPRAAKETCNAR